MVLGELNRFTYSTVSSLQVSSMLIIWKLTCTTFPLNKIRYCLDSYHFLTNIKVKLAFNKIHTTRDMRFIIEPSLYTRGNHQVMARVGKKIKEDNVQSCSRRSQTFFHIHLVTNLVRFVTLIHDNLGHFLLICIINRLSDSKETPF